MKEEKLFDIVSSVDYDLICEALECSPDTEKKGGEYVGALYPAPVRQRKMYYWQYPVTAAALIIVLVGMLFIFNANNTLPYNKEQIDGGQESAAGTDNTEISASAEISEGTQPPVSETTAHIVPYKAVTLGFGGNRANYVLYTDQYPEFHMPDAGEAEFIEINTSQLFEYYGFYCIPYRMELGEFIEVVDENTCHGIYILPDGSVYDINTFTFTATYERNFGKKFTVTLGRNSAFGQEYNPEPDYAAGRTYYYDEERETFFFITEKFGSCIMISGKVDELSDFDDETVKEKFYDDNSDKDWYWQGVPYELGLFQEVVSQCLLEREIVYGNETGSAPVVPDKAVNVGTINVMYTDSYPEFSPHYTTGIISFEEMSTSKLMKYYGLDNILYEMEQGNLTEVTQEDTHHGIYTIYDKNAFTVYDINTFTFITSYDDLYCGKKFTVTVGRVSTFGHEYDMEPDPVWHTTPKYYNEEKETFFGIYEKYGSCIMISGKVNELTDYDDAELKETYHDYNYSDVDDELWQGVPCELLLFNYDVGLCLLDYNRE